MLAQDGIRGEHNEADTFVQRSQQRPCSFDMHGAASDFVTAANQTRKVEHRFDSLSGWGEGARRSQVSFDHPGIRASTIQ
jgi:hypothetical protein